MTNKTETLQTLLWQIRRLLQQLSIESTELLKNLDINPSQRAVLEFLSETEKQTVPDIARQHNVSRQHIQHVVNELLQKELVTTAYNPAHKRSVFIQRTPKGCTVFETIRQRESRILKQLAQQLSLSDLQVTLTSINKISQWLQYR
jgi:DNA-binding MarR family transcriptional regulator